MIDLLIRNGIIVTHDATFSADIAISNGKILGIGECGSFDDANVEFDALGKMIIPGLIDPHVHMSHPYRNQFSDDKFFSTSVSAAFGGTTTLIDFAIQWDKNSKMKEIIEHRIKEVEEEVVIDFSLHATPTKSSEETIKAVADAIHLGVPSFKIYMVYRDQGRMVDDGILYGLLEEMKKRKGILMVHAENDAIAEFNQTRFVTKGYTNPSNFPKVKPNIVEAEAINRVTYLNQKIGSRLYIAHLSTREGLEIIRQSQAKGNPVIAETCPHYLTLSKDEYNYTNGEKFICSPPLRSHEDISALWKGVSNGLISVISSDHCGFGLKQKAIGNGNFCQTPNGLPGIETRLPLIFTEGVAKHRITMNKMVEVLSTNAAKIFGLYPKKGAILPGSDADLTVVDINEEICVTGKKLHGAVDWTPYEGMKLHGFAVATILRGKIIMENGELCAEKGYGKFIPRKVTES
jgi:dihydropyrimidinase